MGRQLHQLSARTVSTLTAAGRHADGGGLYLSISPGGARSWVFMWKVAGKRREMGLGSLRDVSLAKARQKAAEARQKVAAGLDPLATRYKPQVMTFGEAADALIEGMASGWRSEKHRREWQTTLSLYCLSIRNRPVSEIGVDDVLRILRPIWATKAVTASRLRGRIERVLDFARARGHRTAENPARWRGHLDNILPRRPKLTGRHHEAMPFDDVPAFLLQLRQEGGVPARALEFTILTAARSGEVLGARWDEVKFQVALWTVPAARTKGGREHRIPLSRRAIEILEEMQELRRSEFVFPGVKSCKPMSVTTMADQLRRLKVDATVHGFRSAFRDWAGERTAFPREVAEAALAHLVGDEVERAYRRSDALEKRRELMDAWATFLGSGN